MISAPGGSERKLVSVTTYMSRTNPIERYVSHLPRLLPKRVHRTFQANHDQPLNQLHHDLGLKARTMMSRENGGVPPVQFKATASHAAISIVLVAKKNASASGAYAETIKPNTKLRSDQKSERVDTIVTGRC